MELIYKISKSNLYLQIVKTNFKNILALNCLILVNLLGLTKVEGKSIIRKNKTYSISDSALKEIDFNEKNLILMGGINSNLVDPDFYFSVFTHFYDKGVRILVFDLPVCHEKGLVEFVQTGDEQFLEGYGSNFTTLLSLLHDFYLHLPVDDKFIIKTVGTSCFITNYFNSLYDLLPIFKKVPNELGSIVDTISKYKDRGTMMNPFNTDKEHLKFVCSYINKGFEENRNIFSKYLGADEDLFNRIVKGNEYIIITEDCCDSVYYAKARIYRNRYIAKEFEKVLSSLNTSAIGFFNYSDIKKENHINNINQLYCENFVSYLQKEKRPIIEHIYTIKTSLIIDKPQIADLNYIKNSAIILNSTDESSDYDFLIPKSFLSNRKKRTKTKF